MRPSRSRSAALASPGGSQLQDVRAWLTCAPKGPHRVEPGRPRKVKTAKHHRLIHARSITCSSHDATANSDPADQVMLNLTRSIPLPTRLVLNWSLKRQVRLVWRKMASQRPGGCDRKASASADAEDVNDAIEPKRSVKWASWWPLAEHTQVEERRRQGSWSCLPQSRAPREDVTPAHRGQSGVYSTNAEKNGK